MFASVSYFFLTLYLVSKAASNSNRYLINCALMVNDVHSLTQQRKAGSMLFDLNSYVPGPMGSALTRYAIVLSRLPQLNGLNI